MGQAIRGTHLTKAQVEDRISERERFTTRPAQAASGGRVRCAWRARSDAQIRQPMLSHKIVDFTGPDDVQWIEAAEPASGRGVVIDVAAAGVSFADLLQTRGAYQMRVALPYTPGMDAAGVVRFC